MQASPEIHADILKTLMIEDRQEIRGIRSSLYNIITLLCTTSFAVSALLLGREKLFSHTTHLCLVTDVSVILLMWAFYFRSKTDLYFCRQCLIARQDLIRILGTSQEPADLDPFPHTGNRILDVKDTELLWLPVLATVAVVIKSATICLTNF